MNIYNIISANSVYNYLCIYVGYIAVNNLQDDSKQISIEALVKFIHEQIPVDDLNHYLSIGKHLYEPSKYISLYKLTQNRNEHSEIKNP